jgi:phosphotransferase system HPr-like phosphotransfer protein
MALGIRQGDEVLLCAEGEDAAQALSELAALLKANEESEAKRQSGAATEVSGEA